MNTAPSTQSSRGGCRVLITRALKWLGIGLVVLIILGVTYQTIASAQDKQAYPPPGELIDVGGYRLHIQCMGSGSPTVILEAGGISFSTSWYWVQQQAAQTTRVCAYDRAGTGWSDPSPAPRDPANIVEELHTLLTNAGIEPPYVLAGHSFGGPLNRVYAHTYPDDVLGIVLVDSAFVLPREFANDDAYLAWKRENDPLQLIVWATMRTGVYRLTFRDAVRAWGYPAETADIYSALRSSNQSFDTYYAEAVAARRALSEQALAAENLGSLPMIILWADIPALSAENTALLQGYQQDTAEYSSVSETRYVTGSDHGTIIGNEEYAQQVSDAIRDLIAQTAG